MYIKKKKNQQSLRYGRRSIVLAYKVYIYNIYRVNVIQSSITINKELIDIGLQPLALYQAYTQLIRLINPLKLQLCILYTVCIVCRPSICLAYRLIKSTETPIMYTAYYVCSIQAQHILGLKVQNYSLVLYGKGGLSSGSC